MAKGQKRGNREVRKPKAVKQPAAAATFLPSRDKPPPAPAKKKN